MVTGGDGYSNGYDSNGNGDDDGYYYYSYDGYSSVVVCSNKVFSGSWICQNHIRENDGCAMGLLLLLVLQ